jgi:hypothetical protein
MGFEVLRAVLMRTEFFWRVSTLTLGVTVTTRHGVDTSKIVECSVTVTTRHGVDTSKNVECSVLLRSEIMFMKWKNKINTQQFSWYND